MSKPNDLRDLGENLADERHSKPTVSVRKPEAMARSALYEFLLAPQQRGEIGRLGNYRVLRLLGQGGMGLVFHAEDITLGRAVALKVMRPDNSRSAVASERFLREARAMASIKHDNLVTIYQVGQDDETIFIAMEYLQGESLESRLTKRKPWTLAEIARVGRELADGIQVIHERGMIHRDIKPPNIWLESPNDRVKILDFGLARSTSDNLNLTDSNVIMGTPAYMAPEQVRGKGADAKSDLYSLGCVLYTICVGRSPFEAETTMAQLAAVIEGDPIPVHRLNSSLPMELSDLVMQLLEKKPDNRPASAAEVAERLRVIEREESSGEAVPMGSTVVMDQPAGTKTTEVSGVLANHWGKILALTLGAFTLGLLVFVGTIGILWYMHNPGGGDFPLPKKDRPIAFGVKDGKKADADANKVFLKTLPYKDAVNWPTPRLKSKLPKEFIDNPSFHQVPQVNGIFMHAAPPHEKPASVRYELNKKYDTFVARASFSDSSPRSNALIVFSVYGDDERLWSSDKIDSQEQIEECRVSVKGVSILKIMVEGRGDVGGAHCLWLDPYLIPRKEKK